MNAPQSMIVFVLCAWSVALVVGLLVGAVILRAACSIYNGLVGGEYTESGVPSPGFGWAMVIVLVHTIFGTVVNFAVSFGVGILAQQGALAGLNPFSGRMLILAISLPVGFLIHASFTSIMLPTTFGRSCLVVLIQYLIVLLIVVVVGGVLFAVGASMWMNR